MCASYSVPARMHTDCYRSVAKLAMQLECHTAESSVPTCLGTIIFASVDPGDQIGPVSEYDSSSYSETEL